MLLKDPRKNTCRLIGSNQILFRIPEPIIVGVAEDGVADWISTFKPEPAWTVKSALLAPAQNAQR